MSFLLLFIIHHLFLFCLFRALDHLAPTLREVDSLEKPDNNFFYFPACILKKSWYHSRAWPGMVPCAAIPPLFEFGRKVKCCHETD